MEHVIRQARQLKCACGKREAEWGEQSNAISELADAVEALPLEDYDEAINEHLVPLAAEFEELLRNIRSKLVSDVCEQLGRMVKTTRLAFMPLANVMLQGLCDTAKASSVAIRNPGFRLFSDVSEYSRYDLEIVHKVYRSSPQERVRVLLLEQLHIVLTYWPKHEIEPSFNELLDIMRRGMRDPSSHVRTACRQSFCSFTDLWNERVEELLDVPTTPARELLIKEKPHATISKAMQQKYGSTPSKATRADSMNAIRQQRAASKRQGTAAGEDAFIEVTESPHRLLQRPATEPPKRGVSPGRAAPRASSPTAATRGATRTTNGQRAPSPSGMGRSASPGATPRVASPLFGASRGTSAGATSVRGVSSGRVAQASSPRVNGRDQASAAPPANGRVGEFDRYLSLTGQEEKLEFVLRDNREDAPTNPPRDKSQKRVSIAEPPTVDPTRMLSFDSVVSSTSSVPAPQAVSQPSWALKSTTTDTRRFDPKHATSQRQPPPQPPSFGRDPGLTTSFAAAAQNFVSHSQSTQWRHAQPSAAQSATGEQSHFNVTETANQGTPSSAQPSYTRHAPSLPHQKRDDHQLSIPGSSFKPDAFLDRPIPSSAPAPEPRASSNVTTRGRPPSSNVVDPFSGNAHAEGQLPTPVAAKPVPEAQRHDEVRPTIQRPRFLDETFPPPPSASIDFAFLQSNMASINHDEDPFFEDEESENKENIHAAQANIPRASKQVDSLAMDAISVLGVLRGNMRATNEKLEATKAALPMKPPQASTQTKQTDTTAASNLPMKQQQATVIQQAHAQPPAQNQTYHQVRDHHKAVSSAPVLEERRQQQFPAAQKPQQSTPRPQQGTEATVAQQPKTLPQEVTLQQAAAPHALAVPKPIVPIAGAPVSGPHQGPSDFIRTPAPFKFAPPPPRQQQQRPPASAPQVRVPASGAPTPRPASEPSVFERNGFDTRREVHKEQPMSDLHLRQRHLPRDNSPVSSGAKSAAEESSPRPSGGSHPAARRHTVLNPQPQRVPSNVAVKMLYSFGLVLVAIFGLSGLIEAATKVRNAYEYHQSLLDRINQFETSIVESYESVRKMNDKYAVWSEYVRELADQDESNALHQLESIQSEVEKWQREMKSDLLEFKKSLSGDIIDAALAPLRDSNISDDTTPKPVPP